MTKAEYQREIRARDPERYKGYNKKWYNSNPDKHKAACDRWRAAHKERVREHQRNHAKRKAESEGRVYKPLAKESPKPASVSVEREPEIDLVNPQYNKQYWNEYFNGQWPWIR